MDYQIRMQKRIRESYENTIAASEAAEAVIDEGYPLGQKIASVLDVYQEATRTRDLIDSYEEMFGTSPFFEEKSELKEISTSTEKALQDVSRVLTAPTFF